MRLSLPQFVGHRGIRCAWSVLVVMLLVVCSGTALADDGVVVTFHGGTERADAFELVERNGVLEVSEQGQRQLIGDDLGLQVIGDHKILPDGSNLLAGVGGRGVVISDAGGESEFIFASPDSYPRTSSASVMVYAAPGDPGRILMTDSNTSRLLLFEPDDRQIVWQTGFRLPGATGTFADAIAMPNSRVVAGIEYTSLGISAIDVFEFTPGPTGTLLRRLTNRQHANGPTTQIEVAGLHPLRDIFGLPNGHILAATDERLFELDLGGNIQWQVQIVGRAEIQGDISSIALMPSGRVAIATLQPGEWTRPHPNHRVHWLDRSALERSDVEVVARTTALRRAPSSIEVSGGHGASGTFGYRPGLDQQNIGDLANLAVARPLAFSRDAYTPRDTVSGSILVRNEGDEQLFVSRMRVVAVPGECGSSADGAPVTLFDGQFVDLSPGSLFDLRGGLDADEGLTLGRWCAQTTATNDESGSVEVGEPAYFEIVERSDDAGGGTVVVRDVGFWPADAFDGGSGTAPPVDPPGGGCCSHTVHPRAPLPRALLAVALLLFGAIARRHILAR